ncbi:MAG: hypothetical protein AB1558_06215 [Thermodesulfobacteriota bacterium]
MTFLGFHRWTPSSVQKNQMQRQLSIIILVTVLVLTSLLAGHGLTNGHGWGDDFAAYILQTESIVRGAPSEFITDNRFIIEKSMYPIGPVIYPWGFPVLMAPVYGLFGHNIFALKIPGVICHLFFIITLWFGFGRYHAAPWRVALVCLFAFNPGFHLFMNEVVSDIPFLLFSTLSVLMIGKVAVERQRLFSTHVDPLLLGVLIAMSFFIRTNGILLLVMLGIVHLIRVVKSAICMHGLVVPGPMRLREILIKLYQNVREDLWALLSSYACLALCVLSWQCILPEGGSTYVSQFGGLTLSIIKENAYFYAKSPLSFFTIPDAPGMILVKALFLMSIPLFVTGVFRRFGKDVHILIYSTLTLLLYVFWPYQDERFIFPLLPFYISFALTGLEGRDAVSRKDMRLNALRALPVIFVIVFFFWHSVASAHRNLLDERTESTGPYVSTSQELFSFVSRHSDPHNVIVFFKPRAMRLFTGRRSIMTGNVAELERGDYLCIYLREDAYDQLTHRDVAHLLKEGRLQPVYQNSDFQVFRIVEYIKG